MGTTAEKFNYAFGTKDLLKTEINKINNVLTDESTFRSYPQELFNGYLDILNNGTDTLWNNLTKVSQTDVTEAELDNVVTAPMKIDLKGNTSQDTNIKTYVCDGTESGDYYFTENSINYQFTLSSTTDGDILAFNTDTLELTLNSTTITTTTGTSGTQITLSNTPNPDYPQEVKVVKGNNVVSVQGKNLFNKDITLHSGWYNDNGVFQSSTGTSHTEEKYKVKPNETYTLSGNKIAYDTTYVFSRIYYYDKDKNWLYRSTISQPTYSFVIPSNCYYIDFQVSIASGYADDYDSVKDNIQLELGSQATPYTPYSKTDYPINLGNIELCKINTYKDFPFKAINGNEYYDSLTEEQKNALVYGKWYVHKAIGKVVLDGTENWAISGVTYVLNNVINAIYNPSITTNAISISDFFKWGNGTTTTFVYGSFWFNNNGTNIRCQKDETLNLQDFKTWLSTHNVTLYYVLATPTEEEITNTTLIEQLEAISKAKSVKDKTYITQTNDDLPFILDVEAIKEYEVN